MELMSVPLSFRNTTGVTEEALKEFSMMFKYVSPMSCRRPAVLLCGTLNPHVLASLHRHFDKEKSGRLNHQEFKSCLRSLGYDLPMVEEGEPDPEFEAILDTVDPNRSEATSANHRQTHTTQSRLTV